MTRSRRPCCWTSARVPTCTGNRARAAPCRASARTPSAAATCASPPCCRSAPACDILHAAGIGLGTLRRQSAVSDQEDSRESSQSPVTPFEDVPASARHHFSSTQKAPADPKPQSRDCTIIRRRASHGRARRPSTSAAEAERRRVSSARRLPGVPAATEVGHLVAASASNWLTTPLTALLWDPNPCMLFNR